MFIFAPRARLLDGRGGNRRLAIIRAPDLRFNCMFFVRTASARLLKAAPLYGKKRVFIRKIE